MEPSVIHKTRLRDIRPLMWQGRPVHANHSRLRQIIRERLGESHAELLAEPLAPRDASSEEEACWLSGHLRNAKPYPVLSEDERCGVVERLIQLISDIEGLAQEFREGGDAERREIGDLLLEALRVPGLDCIHTDGERISLACWGFTSDQAEQTGFRLSRFVRSCVPADGIPDNPEAHTSASGDGHSDAKIRIRVFDKDKKPAANVRVTASYKGASAEIDTDREGRASFPKVPVPSHVKIGIFLPEHEPFEEDVLCEKDGEEHPITLPLVLGTNSAMRFEIVDALNRRLQNIPLRLEYKDTVLEDSTDEEGRSEFADIPVGEKVTLHVRLPRQKPLAKEFHCIRQEELHQVIVESEKRRGRRLPLLAGILLVLGVFLLVWLFLGKKEPPPVSQTKPPATSSMDISKGSHKPKTAAPGKDCGCEEEMEKLWREIRQLKEEIRQSRKN